MKEPMAERERAERIQRLRAVPLFAECSEATLESLLDIATEFEAERGHVLVQSGKAGAGLFVLEEGSVVVSLPHETIELGPGEFFGELALLDEHALRTARVSASAGIRCLAISRDDFHRLLSSEPTIAIAMLKVLAHRLTTILRH
jgi:CRP-like cAMP-binding protein